MTDQFRTFKPNLMIRSDNGVEFIHMNINF